MLTALSLSHDRILTYPKASVPYQPRRFPGLICYAPLVKTANPKRLLGIVPNTLMETLQIEITEVSAERVVGRMPVGPRVHQPIGLLHGGASVVLAETVASVGGIAGAPEGYTAVGLEINANHLRSVTSGMVEAVATRLHAGRRTQIWRIEIHDDQGRRICESRCTVSNIPESREAPSTP